MAGNIPGTRYSTSKFLNRFGNLAQSSQYKSHIGFTQNLWNALVANRIPRLLLSEAGMLCKSTSLPGSAISTHDVRDFYGVVQKSAYMRQFDNTIDLTFYIDSDYQIMYMFEAWMEYIMPLVGRNPKASNTTYVANYPENYKGDLYLYKFNKDRDASWGVVNPIFDRKGSIVYTFINAFPINISSSDVSYDPSQNLEFTVTFAYERYVTDKTGVRTPRGLGQDSFRANSQPLLNAPRRNPSNNIRHPNASAKMLSEVNAVLADEIGDLRLPNPSGNRVWSVNSDEGEPRQSDQATQGNESYDINGKMGDFNTTTGDATLASNNIGNATNSTFG